MKKLLLLFIAVGITACGKSTSTNTGVPNPGISIADPAPPQFIIGDARQKIVAKLTKGLSEERDKMEGISFFSPKNSNLLSPRLDAYVSLPDTGAPLLRMMPVYYGEDWIFYDSIKVMADDKVVYEHIFPDNSVHHDNHGGSVWETGDYVAAAYDLSALRTIANAKSATIRFSGREHRYDHDLTPQEFANLKQVISTYDDLLAQLRKPG